MPLFIPFSKRHDFTQEGWRIGPENPRWQPQQTDTAATEDCIQGRRLQ